MRSELNFSERFEQTDVGVEGDLFGDEEREPAGVEGQTFERQRDVGVGIGRDGDREYLETVSSRQVGLGPIL